MPSASTFRDLAMAYIGVGNSALIPSNASTAMMQALNRALQQVFGNERKEKVSLQVRGPTAITIDAVTNGSKTITFAGFQPWMTGCTVQISGDALANQFELSSASVTLNAPFQGATQSNVGATVYQDSLNLTSEVKAVYPPALLNNQYFVEPLDSRNAQIGQRTIWQNEWTTTPKTSRRPETFILEDNLPYLQTPTTRITFDSLPDTTYVFGFEAELKAPRVTSWSDTRNYFIPGEEDESILYPWALGEFMAWPQFLDDNALRQIVANQAGEARTRWTGRTKGFTHTGVDVQSW
jgi:hypothetical protein